MSFQYMSLTQLVDSGRYPFTLGQMRSFLLHRGSNGLDLAVRKIGRRLYLRLDLFEAWIEGKEVEDDVL